MSAGGNGNDVDFDKNGILRRNPERAPYNWGSSRWLHATRWEKTIPEGWRVGYCNGVPCWFLPTHTSHWMDEEALPVYRCGRALTEEEFENYWAVSAYDRKRMRLSKVLRRIADLS